MRSDDVVDEPRRGGGEVDEMRNCPTIQERVATKRVRGGPASWMKRRERAVQSMGETGCKGRMQILMVLDEGQQSVDFARSRGRDVEVLLAYGGGRTVGDGGG